MELYPSEAIKMHTLKERERAQWSLPCSFLSLWRPISTRRMRAMLATWGVIDWEIEMPNLRGRSGRKRVRTQFHAVHLTLQPKWTSLNVISHDRFNRNVMKEGVDIISHWKTTTYIAFLMSGLVLTTTLLCYYWLSILYTLQQMLHDFSSMVYLAQYCLLKIVSGSEAEKGSFQSLLS